MPNWAYTSYRIVGKKEEVQYLYSKIQQLQNMKNHWSQTVLVIYGLVVFSLFLVAIGKRYIAEVKLSTLAWMMAYCQSIQKPPGQKCKKFANSFNKITPHLKSSTMKKNLDGVSIKPMIMINDSFPSAISLMIWKEMDQNIMMTSIHYLKQHLKFSVRS